MNNNILNNNNIPQISASASYTYKSDAQKKEDEELIKSMNIPPRDEEAYPMPSKENIEAAGEFLWKLNLLASSYDQNMQALIWDLYVSMNNFLRDDATDIDREKALGLQTLINLNKLKIYVKESDNPIFKNNKK